VWTTSRLSPLRASDREVRFFIWRELTVRATRAGGPGGHLAGDRAILTCAEILRHSTRPTDLIARIGGDEFLLWLDGVTQDSAAGRAQALLAHAGRLTALSAVPEKPLGVSLGIAVYDGSAPDVLESLIARADAAMYRAKSRRKSGYQLAAPAESPADAAQATDDRGDHAG